ncbi:MAG: hypothetical protein ACRC35_04910 [Angustibacter sp.]
MKTAISVPDETFEAATRRARELGMSRSEFFTTAAERYLSELDRSSLSARIDEALAAGSAGDSSWADVVEASKARLAREPEW